MYADVALALRDDAQTVIVERLNWDEETQGPYNGPVPDRVNRIFSYMQDRVQRQKIFRQVSFGGNLWNLWGLHFTENLPEVKVELDYLDTEYPNHIIIAGAWLYKHGDIACRQAGTQLIIDTRTVTKTWSILNPDYQPDPVEPNYDPVYVIRVTGDVEEEYVSGYTGTPEYPIPPQLIDFAPDEDDVGTRPTALRDYNLLQGQPPRDYTP